MKRIEFDCVDAHTCGNPVRVVRSNAPLLQGDSMSERRQDFLQNHDWIRTGLMFEPRGHDAMSGSIVYPPINTDSDAAILFIEVSGCLPMCGHGTIGTVTVMIEENLIQPKQNGTLRLDTPAGLIIAEYTMNEDFVESVTLTNVPSYLHSVAHEVAVPGIGTLTMDVAFGGNFYAIIEPQKNYQDLANISVDQIRTASPLIRQSLNQQESFVHPIDSSIQGVSHVMWTGQPTTSEAHARNAVFYGDRGIDRSPCGTGTSARMAQLVARDDLGIGDTFVHESIIGSLFIGKPINAVELNGIEAITPSISGWARVIGHNRISIDERDPYAHGFLLS
jgi:4-hydroxyproline epimerase